MRFRARYHILYSPDNTDGIITAFTAAAIRHHGREPERGMV